MAFPIEYLDLEDIGREVVVVLHGGVSFQATITGIHAVTESDGEIQISIDTNSFEDLVLQPDSFVQYTDL